MVCERWSVTVCKRWCVTKWCEKMVCDKVVCERWCVTKWCVKDCVKDGVSKLVCQSWCVKDLPRNHSSSPCKPSCSEPQRTLLAVELQTLILFNMLASMFYSFSMFFQGLLPAISSFPQRFPRYPWFFQAVFPSLPFMFSPNLRVFLQFSPIFPPVFNALPSFSLVFSYLLPTVFKGPRGDRNPPSPNCLVAHAPPKKNSISSP